MRGRTTQKRVSSTRKSLAWGSISALTTTLLWSGVRRTARTVPTSTALCLILVLPASMPSADSKRMVMVGPRSSTVLKKMLPPISAARAGMIHTSCSVRGLGLRATARGTSPSSGTGGRSFMAIVHRIPDEARIEALGGEHGEDHHRAEEYRAGAGQDFRERAQLDQGHGERAHEDVHHRPAPDVRVE